MVKSLEQLCYEERTRVLGLEWRGLRRGTCGCGSKTTRVVTNAELLLPKSHSTAARVHLRKLADQFRMGKRKYCPHPAVSFGNFT